MSQPADPKPQAPAEAPGAKDDKDDKDDKGGKDGKDDKDKALVPDQVELDPVRVQEALAAAAGAAAFGAQFFARDLPALVKQRCPDPAVALPRVFMHLAGGDVLHVLHIIGLTPRWLALAVHNDDGERTETVPYAAIARVVIEAVKPGEGSIRIGFRQETKPAVIGP